MSADKHDNYVAWGQGAQLLAVSKGGAFAGSRAAPLGQNKQHQLNVYSPKQTFTTTVKLGKRLVDEYNATKKTIYEVKYGYMSLSEFIKKEIAKDQYLLNSKIVKYVEWHFYISQTTGKGGPSAPLREALRKVGIKIVEHF